MAAPIQAPEKVKVVENIKDKLNKSSISDFFNNDTLSDITVVNPQTGAQYK